MDERTEFPFAELPAALVEHMLKRAQDVRVRLQQEWETFSDQREQYRKQLRNQKYIQRAEDLVVQIPVPTTCGVDGSYALERMLASDFVAVAAVAVEGLTPPSEERHWPEPHHRAYINTEVHHPDTALFARALMMGMELELASEAPHTVVFLDGSLTTPLIYFNQAFTRIGQDNTPQVAHELIRSARKFLQSYLSILRAQRTDKQWVAVPKYSSRRELADTMRWKIPLDDRALLTHVLDAGELTRPIPLALPSTPWHLNIEGLPEAEQLAELRDELIRLLEKVRVVYYRPNSWLPALRLELPRQVATNNARLAQVIQALRYQCSAPGILEPYPLYMADRMVKHLHQALSAVRQVTTQQLAERVSDINAVFLNLHAYRTESGQ